MGWVWENSPEREFYQPIQLNPAQNISIVAMSEKTQASRKR